MAEREERPSAAAAELVCEYVDSGGRRLGVEATRGVLRGVKLLGLKSRNGRRYAEAALRSAIGLYEGAKVNVNHPERSPLSARDYRDRLGVVRNVRLERGEGLFGDLHYNPKHALAEQLEWDAEHASQNVGLSHNVLARTRREEGGVVVEAITQVQSVDLVADPATTAGLFEQQGADDSSPGSEDPADPVREPLERLVAERVEAERRAEVQRLLEAHGLGPDSDAPAPSDAALRALVAAGEENVLPLIEDRARVAAWVRTGRRPESREQPPFFSEAPEAPADAEAFVEAISRRVG